MAQSPRLVIGNWKMKLSYRQSLALANSLKAALKKQPALKSQSLEIGVCPDFLALPKVAEILRRSVIACGGQDACWQDKGACTGEVSPVELASLGCSYVILGHSERRLYNNETDSLISKKVIAALNSGLTPILCIGESGAERKSGKTMQILKRQLSILKKIKLDKNQKLVIAYEPVWAIGSGLSLSPEDAYAAHAMIKKELSIIYSEPVVARQTRVLYGGSVDAKNVLSLAQVPGIDGFLVGGASLRAAEFLKICSVFLK
jgi:triosephosphate isomerase